MKLAAQKDLHVDEEIRFTDEVSWRGHLQLACPLCGDGYLHHDVVDVFERLRGEDGDSFRFRLNGAQLETSLIAESDTPGRRNSVEIRFYCEQCSFDDHGRSRSVFFVLQVLQHKGCTYLSWSRAYEVGEA